MKLVHGRTLQRILDGLREGDPHTCREYGPNGMNHTATLLRNGKVVLAGGNGASWTVTPAKTLVCDPETGAWSAAPAVTHQRVSHTATLLENGKILFVGGVNAEWVIQGIEVYAP